MPNAKDHLKAAQEEVNAVQMQCVPIILTVKKTRSIDANAKKATQAMVESVKKVRIACLQMIYKLRFCDNLMKNDNRDLVSPFQIFGKRYFEQNATILAKFRKARSLLPST